MLVLIRIVALIRDYLRLHQFNIPFCFHLAFQEFWKITVVKGTAYCCKIPCKGAGSEKASHSRKKLGSYKIYC